ncbi:serine/threonine protein kinase [Sphingomonas sp. Leaf412]|uniref:serine/threonine-protein kinase n=1 Tax=Sphingomonas sp. Leaf412 TaxID=1736370 RepID=UPI0006FC5E56|nr:serine/threonine-protein kinase [Sphingomonas sp. Leaf412]KQT34720.1 serine/threonine protein kinase [Sphingomonas sp. Leaf412]
MEMLGRYRIEGKLGDGAMADVYHARDTGIGRSVAIKVLKPDLARDPELSRRFLREAQAAGGLNHPGIATIYDVGIERGIAYIAMELVEGQPLDAVLAAHGRLPHERVLLLAEQLAAALAYAHRAGVVHRDVKPSNILLSADGRTAKLVDFGVARVADLEGTAAEQALVRTQVGQLIGTPRYMSPEQALGLPVDARSDLFSFGVVLYEMVTGKVAFPGTGLATLAIQIAQDRVDPIDRAAGDCSPGLRAIIDKLLAKKPEARFADGDLLVRALERERQSTADAPPARRGLPLRVKLPLSLAIVTALALAVSVTTILKRQQQTLQRMAVVSGSSIAGFVTQNTALLAADNAGLPPEQQDWSALQAFVVSAARDREIRGLVVTDTGGIVRAADDASLVGRRHRVPRGEARVPATGGARVSSVPDNGKGAGLRFVQPIRYAGADFGTLDLVLRRQSLDAALDQSRTLLAILSLLVIAAVLIVGYLSGSWVARPLARLRRALDEAPESRFALRISHHRRDELGAAFEAFNRAAAAIEPELHGAPRETAATLAATRIVTRPPSRHAA